MNSVCLLVVTFTLATFSTVGCGGGDQSQDTKADPKSIHLTLTGDDRMRFDQDVLRVPADAKVTLTLKHEGKMALSAMGHNFVRLKKGVDVDVFALAAARAFQTDYIPANKKNQVIAYTKMLGGGESDTIVFDAPPTGTYKFICSFPGHYATMQGDFIVR